MTKNERNVADGCFSTACYIVSVPPGKFKRISNVQSCPGHPYRLESSSSPGQSFFCSFDLATVLVILLGNTEYWLNIFEISVGAHLCAPVLSAAEGMVSRLKPLLQQDTMSLE